MFAENSRELETGAVGGQSIARADWLIVSDSSPELTRLEESSSSDAPVWRRPVDTAGSGGSISEDSEGPDSRVTRFPHLMAVLSPNESVSEGSTAKEDGKAREAVEGTKRGDGISSACSFVKREEGSGAGDIRKSSHYLS